MTIARRIYKYEIPFPKDDEAGVVVHMPRNARVLSVGEQQGEIFAWALVEPGAEMQPRRFWIHGTGHPVSVRADEAFSRNRARAHTRVPRVRMGTDGVSDDDLDFASLHLPPKRTAPWTPRTTAERLNEEARERRARNAAPSSPTIDHASYLGASDIGAILGLDPMRTPLDVWSEKTGRIPRAESDALEAGNDHEEGVVRGFTRWALRNGLVERVEYPGPGTILGWEARVGVDGVTFNTAWRGATLDALAIIDDRRRAAVEAKLVGGGMASSWGPEPAGADGIPPRTLAQVHWQTLHARERWPDLEWSTAFVAADIAGTDRRRYVVPIDDELLASLLEAGREWWRAHVIADVMPEPEASDLETLAAMFPSVERPGLDPVPPDGLRELAEDLFVAREIAARHRLERDKIAAKLEAMIGDREGFRWRNGRVMWREDSRGGRRLTVNVWEDRG